MKVNVSKLWVLSVLFVHFISAAEDVEKKEDILPSSVSMYLSFGEQKYSESSLGGIIGLSQTWALEVYAAGSRLNGNVVARDFGLSTIARPSEAHEFRFEMAFGGQSDIVSSRSFGVGYEVDLASLYSNAELKTLLSLNVSSTIYTIDGMQVSPREARSYISLNQDISPVWSVGVSFISASYTDQAVQSYRSYIDRKGLDTSLAAYEAGPLEKASAVNVVYRPSEANRFRYELHISNPVQGGEKSTSSSIGWDTSLNANWEVGLKLSSTKIADQSSGTFGFGAAYAFE